MSSEPAMAVKGVSVPRAWGDAVRADNLRVESCLNVAFSLLKKPDLAIHKTHKEAPPAIYKTNPT